MLWNASAITGYAVLASDGTLGTVSDLLFDDSGWEIRWLVVDTGTWLTGRKVLLPPEALGQPDQVLRRFPVLLTMQQVGDSPPIDADQPVSRQAESLIYDHYGWDPYWGSSFIAMSNAMATPFVAPLHLPGELPASPADDSAPHTPVDRHLRSIAAVTGYSIQAADGDIGHVEDFLVDDAAWRVRYLTVETGNWWPGEKVLISPWSVRDIDWEAKSVLLTVDRGKVKLAPPYVPTMTVDGAYDATFQTYYGIRWTAA
jgi:uncharacterized protein YrrD